MFEDSTHGGRQRNRAGCVGTHHFNSRPHGGRHPARCPVPFPGYFNSRPHGGRRFFRSLYFYRDYFNSRPHGGRPIDWRSSPIYFSISTHALTEGDFKTIKRWSIDYHFNSRPHGGRQGFCRRSGGCPDFNSRPHGGRRSSATSSLHSMTISTHALTEGDTFLLYSYHIS